MRDRLEWDGEFPRRGGGPLEWEGEPPRMGGGPLEWDEEPLERDGEPLEWGGEPPRMGLGWDWDPDWFTPQKTNKTENRVFTKNLTKRQFLHIKTNFFTKT